MVSKIFGSSPRECASGVACEIGSILDVPHTCFNVIFAQGLIEHKERDGTVGVSMIFPITRNENHHVSHLTCGLYLDGYGSCFYEDAAEGKVSRFTTLAEF